MWLLEEWQWIRHRFLEGGVRGKEMIQGDKRWKVGERRTLLGIRAGVPEILCKSILGTQLSLSKC
jgi:hypothetical protein